MESYQRHLFDYRKRDGNPLAMASQHSRLAPLKVWFKWLVRRGYIALNPAEELELPRVSCKLPNVLNKEEAEMVLHRPNLQNPIGIRDRAILEIFYSTGMRRTELLKLRLFDVDQKQGLIAIREGKGKRDRIVPVGERALFWLGKYLSDVRPTIVGPCDASILFLTINGASFTPNHLSWLARFYVKAADLGKMGACHIFRHYLPFLTMSSDTDSNLCKSEYLDENADAVSVSPNIVFSTLQVVKEREELIARVIAG